MSCPGFTSCAGLTVALGGFCTRKHRGMRCTSSAFWQNKLMKTATVEKCVVGIRIPNGAVKAFDVRIENRGGEWDAYVNYNDASVAEAHGSYSSQTNANVWVLRQANP